MVGQRYVGVDRRRSRRARRWCTRSNAALAFSGGWPDRSIHRAVRSLQLLQQRRGRAQVGRLESFSEPAVDGGEKLASFSPPTLTLPETSHLECLLQSGFGAAVCRLRPQDVQLAIETEH